MDHLALWDEFRRTDPAATKPFKKGGGFQGTQIDPVWRVKRMTEVFGPIGKGWGYTIHERWKESLHVKVKNGPREPVDTVFVRLSAWYMRDGERYDTGEQIGGTQVEYTPDEVYKQAVTDALGKCLSNIGLGADIYMGQYDDSKYREEVEQFYQAKNNPDTQPQAIERFEHDIQERMAEVKTLDALDEIWRSGVGARLREIALVNKVAHQRIIALFSTKKAEILKSEAEASEVETPSPAAADDGPFSTPQKIEAYLEDVRGQLSLVTDLDGMDELWRSLGAKQILKHDNPAGFNALAKLFSTKKAAILEHGEGDASDGTTTVTGSADAAKAAKPKPPEGFDAATEEGKLVAQADAAKTIGEVDEAFKAAGTIMQFLPRASMQRVSAAFADARQRIMAQAFDHQPAGEPVELTGAQMEAISRKHGITFWLRDGHYHSFKRNPDGVRSTESDVRDYLAFARDKLAEDPFLMPLNIQTLNNLKQQVGKFAKDVNELIDRANADMNTKSQAPVNA